MESTKQKLLDWEKIDLLKYKNRDLNPIDIFIHENEASGVKGLVFRNQLLDALRYEDEESRTTRNIEIIGMFIEHCEEEGFTIPEKFFNSFFNV